MSGRLHRSPDSPATGWRTTGDALLANTAAAQARNRRHVAKEEAHEIDTYLSELVEKGELHVR